MFVDVKYVLFFVLIFFYTTFAQYVEVEEASTHSSARRVLFYSAENMTIVFYMAKNIAQFTN